MNKSLYVKTLVIAIAASFLMTAGNGLGNSGQSNETFETANITKLLQDKSLDTVKISDRLDNALNMVPPIEDPQSVVFQYGFETEAVGDVPTDPPWLVTETTASDYGNWGPYDFENNTVGENPNDPPWTTVDGATLPTFFSQNYEAYAPAGTTIGPESVTGDQGYFWTMDAAATLTSATPPAGAPPGRITPAGYTTGGISCDFVDGGAGSYFGPAGTWDTTSAYAGGWFYMKADTRLDVILYDLVAGDLVAEVAIYPGGQLIHWPAGVGVAIAGPTWTVNTWHELIIQYDETTLTYSVWWDGTQYVAGSAFAGAGTNVDGLIIFGDGTTSAYVDNFMHFLPATGGTHVVDVSNAWSYSGTGGTQSVFLDQNSYATTPASVNVEFPAPYAWSWAGVSWVFRTSTTVANTNGAQFQVLDFTGRTLMAIRCSGGQIQYQNGAVWTDMMAFTANTEYTVDAYMDSTVKTYNIDIDWSNVITGATLVNLGAGIGGFQVQGTLSTESEIYFDDVQRWGDLQDGTVRVSDAQANSGIQSVHMWEGGGDTACDMGAYMGGDLARYGEFWFNFYGDGTLGGGQVYLMDTTQTYIVTIISLGSDLTAANIPNPGQMTWVDGDGAGGGFVVDGPAIPRNTWNNVSVRYDIGSGAIEIFWNGVSQGTYGILESGALDAGIALFFGEGPAAPCDWFFDDIGLFADQVPLPPTNSWAEIPEPTGLESWDNYTTDQDNYVEGTVTGTEANTHGLGTEDVREVALGDVPTWVNYSTNQDNAVEGVVVGSEANTHGPGSENITEVVPGGSMFLNYTTDLDIPVEGVVTGTEVNTHGPGTEDIQEIRLGGDVWINYTTIFDFPIEGTVTGTEANTHGPGTEDIQEVMVAGSSATFIDETFDAGVPPAGWAQDGPSNQWSSSATANAGGTAPEARMAWVNTVGTWHLYAGPFDTTGYSTLDFEFQNFLNDYGAGATMLVQTSTDATTWQDTTWSQASGGGDIGPALVSFSIATSDVGSATFYVSFTLTGNAYQIDYWYIDNVVLSGTRPAGYSLQHRWQTQTIDPSATALTLFVDARTNTGSDDTFTFEYSTDGAIFIPTTIVVNTDVLQTYTFSLPPAIMGLLYFGVVDDTSGDVVQQDTVYIDNIRVEYYQNIPVYHSLEHRWRTQAILPGSDLMTLYVDAATSAGSDDTFSIGYSTVQAGPYTPVITVNSDIMQTYSAVIPSSLSGQLYLSVIDDNGADPVQQDSVIVDNIRIEGFVGNSLEHRWRTDAVDVNTLILELFVTARTNTGSDDSFIFGYSTSLAGPYTPTTIVVSSDAMATYSALMPIITGEFYLNVIDNNTMDTVLQDTIIIDTIRLESAISSATMTNQVARAEIPGEGTVTGTYVMTTSIPPDGTAQQIQEIPLSKKKSAPSPTPLYTPSVIVPIRSEDICVKNSAPSTALSNKIIDVFDQLHNMQSSGTTPLSPGPQPGTRATILSEDFSAAWIPSTDADIYAQPPGGWDVDGICTSQAAAGLTRYWSQFDDAVTGFPTSNSTPYAAGVWWSNAEPAQDEWLISPSMDLSGSMNTMLYFDAAYAMPSYGSAATAMDWVKVSIDGGLSWTNMGDLAHDPQFEIPGATGGPAGAGWCWYEMYLAGQTAIPIDLSAFDFQPDVRIAFHYEVTDTAALPFGIWAIDDVRVEADPAGNSLAHVWTMEPQPADSTTRTLFVTARTDAATTEGFTFGWSQNAAGPFTPVISIDSDVFQTKSVSLPTGFSGDLYINVIDNLGADFGIPELSSIFVDCIRVFNDNSIAPERSLEHRWRTRSIDIGAQSLVLHVTARTSLSANDEFTFGYSTVLGGPYIPTTITVNSDVMSTYSAILPYALNGQIYLNVVDSLADWSQPGYLTSADTIFIDEIIIEYYTPGGAMMQEWVIMDRPGHGNVTGTYVLTQSSPPDGLEQQIDEVDPTIYPPNLPSSASYITPFSPVPGPKPAAQVYYNSRAAFDADGGADLPIEDFEAANVAAGSLNTMTAPLDEFTNNAFFVPGDILPGIQISDNPGPDADDFIILGGGFAGEPDKTVCTNTFADSIDIVFPNNDVYAVGMDIQSFTNPCNPTITLYTTGDVLLATTTAAASNAGTFWGVISDEVIYRINIFDAANTDGADNIAFGSVQEKAYSLAHAWEMDLQPNMLTRTLYMNARLNSGANDNFTIGYVTNYADLANDKAWMPLFNVTSDTATDYSVPIPVTFNGEFFLIAWDTNTKDEGGPANADTLYVDEITMVGFQSAGDTSVDIHWDTSLDDYAGTWANNYTVDQDNPVEGTVTNTYTNVDEINPLDGITENIQETYVSSDIYFNYNTDLDIPVEGAVTGTEANTHGAGTEDIQETFSSLAAPIISEDFEGTWPPTGWTVNNYGATYDWNTNTYWGNTNRASTGMCADADSDASGGGMNTGLRTPAFSLVGYTAANLDFMHSYNDITTPGGDYGEVRVSLDGGGTWQPAIITYDADYSPTGPGVAASLSLNAYLGQASVMVEFHYVDAGWDWWWMVDDVVISGTLPEYSLEHRWRTESIIPGATTYTLYVDAQTNTGADDTFTFGYSTDDITYTPTTITVNSDVMQTYSATLPGSLTGQIYLRVLDDTSGDATQQDTIFVDSILVEYYYDVIPQYSLEHRWRSQAVAPLIASLTLSVTANRNGGADDSFMFGYSTTLGGPYTPTTISVNSATMQTYTASLPTTLTGVFYINVIDMNQADTVQQDTLYIDAITLQYSGFIPGLGENDIAAYNIYRADQEDGDTVAGPYTYIGNAPAGTNIYYDVGEGIDLVNQAWYYVESEDAAGQTSRSGNFSKLNFAPLTTLVRANGLAELLIVPETLSVALTANVFDDSSTWEAIPKIDGAEWYDTTDPGEGAGTAMNDDGALTSENEPFNFALDTSLWAPLSSHQIFVRGHEAAPGNTGSGWGTPVFVWINVTRAAWANATGPIGGPTNIAGIIITYTITGTPTSVNLYYTTDGGLSWALAGNDATLDGSYNFTCPSSGAYGWIASAMLGGSTEPSPPIGGTLPEASSYIYDDLAPTITATTFADGATGIVITAGTYDADFSENMQAVGSVTTNLVGAFGSWVDADTYRITYLGLVPSTLYTITYNGFLDAAGNPLGGDTEMNFTTASVGTVSTWTLYNGRNYVTFTSTLTAGWQASNLAEDIEIKLELLGETITLDNIQITMYDSLFASFTTALYMDGVGWLVDFPLAEGQGYIVEILNNDLATSPRTYELPNFKILSPVNVPIYNGRNYLGFPAFAAPAPTMASELAEDIEIQLEALGETITLDNIQITMYDSLFASFTTALYMDGVGWLVDFPLDPSAGYIVEILNNDLSTSPRTYSP